LSWLAFRYHQEQAKRGVEKLAPDLFNQKNLEVFVGYISE